MNRCRITAEFLADLDDDQIEEFVGRLWFDLGDLGVVDPDITYEVVGEQEPSE